MFRKRERARGKDNNSDVRLRGKQTEIYSYVTLMINLVSNISPSHSEKLKKYLKKALQCCSQCLELVEVLHFLLKATFIGLKIQ